MVSSTVFTLRPVHSVGETSVAKKKKIFLFKVFLNKNKKKETNVFFF